MRHRRILWFLVFLACLFSLGIGIKRFFFERSHRTVELALDYDSFANTARSQGWDIQSVLGKLKNRGVTSVALSEDTPEKMQVDGRIRWMMGRDLEILSRNLSSRFGSLKRRIRPGGIFVFVYDEATRNQIMSYLSIYLGPARVHSWNEAPASGRDEEQSRNSPMDIIEVSTDPGEFPTSGIGFSPSLVRILVRQGFNIILRPENRDTFTPDSIGRYFLSLSGIPGVSAVIFGGQDNDVVGYPNNLDFTLTGLGGMKACLGLVEVPNVRLAQKGSRYLALRMPGRAARVQSISPLQLVKLDSGEVLEKFMLGIRERNIRIAYLRPLAIPDEGRDLLETNLEFAGRLGSFLKKRGFTLGKSAPIGDFEPSPFSLLVLTLGAAAAMLLLLDRFRRLPENLCWSGLIISVLCFAAAMVFGTMPLLRKVMALGAAISFPTLALVMHFRYFKEAGRSLTARELIGRATMIYCRVCLITVMGGLTVAALLSSTPFFLQIDQFRGIKLVMLIPLVLVLCLYLAREGNFRDTMGKILDFPIFAKHLAALVLAVGLLVFYILRTGNAPEGATSDIERLFRSFLDRTLMVRPRLKEFLLGHPALILTSAYSFLGYETGIWGLILLACMGQADIIDTFCHLHTPLSVTILRVFNGMVLGWMAGVLLLLVFFRLISGRGGGAET